MSEFSTRPVRYADCASRSRPEPSSPAAVRSTRIAVTVKVPPLRRLRRRALAADGLRSRATPRGLAAHGPTRSPTRSSSAHLTARAAYFDSRGWSTSRDRAEGRAREKRLRDHGLRTAPTTSSSPTPRSIVLAPRILATGDRVLYTSYEIGLSADLRVWNVGFLPAPAPRRAGADTMTFAPRFTAERTHSRLLAYTEARQHRNLPSRHCHGLRRRLTSAPSIGDRAPSFSPPTAPGSLRERPGRAPSSSTIMPATRRRAAPDQLRAGPLRHARLVAARRSHRLHQAETRAASTSG